MAELFGREFNLTTAVTPIPGTNFVFPVSTNALVPPFATAKAVGFALAVVTPGTGGTSLAMQVIRNATGENVIVASVTVAATPGQAEPISLAFQDRISDGRSVTYTLGIQQPLASAAGSIAAGAAIDASLLSG